MHVKVIRTVGCDDLWVEINGRVDGIEGFGAPLLDVLDGFLVFAPASRREQNRDRG
jgi:hypothetical protein